eukprot:g15186.t1
MRRMVFLAALLLAQTTYARFFLTLKHRMKFLKAVAFGFSSFTLVVSQDDACHTSHKAKADCMGDSKCSWCEA